jgi:hypothetical protein
MTRAMRNLALIICLLAGCCVAQQAPETMKKIEVILQSPDVPAGSFAAKPKVMYRAGNRYCRIEEAADLEQGIHGLLIINEPDYWMVNLLTKTAKHGIDPGPTFNCRMPIFPDSSGLELEFGNELAYFKNKGATPQQGPVLQTKQTTAYNLDLGDFSLTLFTYGTPERPLAVARVRGEKHEIFWYSGYGEMQFDSNLFTKPKDVKIEDSKP